MAEPDPEGTKRHSENVRTVLLVIGIASAINLFLAFRTGHTSTIELGTLALVSMLFVSVVLWIKGHPPSN